MMPNHQFIKLFFLMFAMFCTSTLTVMASGDEARISKTSIRLDGDWDEYFTIYGTFEIEVNNGSGIFFEKEISFGGNTLNEEFVKMEFSINEFSFPRDTFEYDFYGTNKWNKYTLQSNEDRYSFFNFYESLGESDRLAISTICSSENYELFVEGFFTELEKALLPNEIKNIILSESSKKSFARLNQLCASVVDSALDKRSYITRVQTWLNWMNLEPGSIDGKWGNRSKRALNDFYTLLGIEDDGVFEQEDYIFVRDYIKRGGPINPSFYVAEIQKLLNELGFQSQISGMVDNETRNSLISASETFDCLENSNNNIFLEINCLQSETKIYENSKFYLLFKNIKSFNFEKLDQKQDQMFSSLGFYDVDADGINEVYLGSNVYGTLNFYPIKVFTYRKDIEEVSSVIFQGDVPTCSDCHNFIFTDVNLDSFTDMVLSDAGQDQEPWTATSIEIALGNGSSFSRVTPQLEALAPRVRSYATAVGNLDEDLGSEIILSSGNDWGRKSRIIRFYDEKISSSPNPWLAGDYWQKMNLPWATSMHVVDIDLDNRNDLYVGVGGASETAFTNTVFWSGLLKDQVSALPAPFFGIDQEAVRVDLLHFFADTTSSIFVDFNNDGMPDFLGAHEGVMPDYTNSGNIPSVIQVAKQVDPRVFEDVTPSNLYSPQLKYYLDPIAYDVNSDGFMDIILNYWLKNGARPNELWYPESFYGSEILLNRGDFGFERIDLMEKVIERGFWSGYVVPYGPEKPNAYFMISPGQSWTYPDYEVRVMVVEIGFYGDAVLK